jgi:hypothetical protein
LTPAAIAVTSVRPAIWSGTPLLVVVAGLTPSWPPPLLPHAHTIPDRSATEKLPFAATALTAVK